MDNLQFILSLKDLLSPAMQNAASISDSTAARVAGDVKQINAGIQNFSSQTSSQLDKLMNKFDQWGEKVEQRVSKAKTSLGGFVSGFKSAIAGIGIAALLTGTLGQAMQQEQQRISYSVMTGSQAKGDALLGNLRNYANVTPYEQKDVTGAAQTLLQFGVDQNKIVPEIKTIGDIAAGSAEKMQSLTLAYAQIQSANKLQGQDLLQLINAGFNPLLEISKMTGVSLGDLKKAMEKGAISADMVTAAFQHATGPAGQFYQMTEKQAQTLGGRWSTFMDAAKMKLLALGNLLAPVASALLSFTTALMDGEPAVWAIVVAITGFTAAVYANSIATGVAGLATKAWAVAQGLLNVIMEANPIILFITAIISLGLWIYSLTKKYEGWGNSMKALWAIIKEFISLNITVWKAFGETVWYYVQYGWLKFESFIQWIGGALMNVWNSFNQLIHGNFSEAKDALFKQIITPADKELDNLQKKHLANQQEYAKAAATSLNNISKSWQNVGLKKIAETGTTTDPIKQQQTIIDTKDLMGGGDDKKGGGKNKAESINSGGQRTITINIAKQTGAENIYVSSGKEAANEIESQVREAMRRIMLSLNGNSVSPN